MSIEKQLKILEKNISTVLCPEMLSAMNQKYNELITLKNQKL